MKVKGKKRSVFTFHGLLCSNGREKILHFVQDDIGRGTGGQVEGSGRHVEGLQEEI